MTLKVRLYEAEATFNEKRCRWVCSDKLIGDILNADIPSFSPSVPNQMKAMADWYVSNGLPIVVVELEEGKSVPNLKH